MAKLRAFRGLQYLTLPSNGEASSDDAQRLLQRVRPSHAPLWIDKVRLVDVTADSDARPSPGNIWRRSRSASGRRRPRNGPRS
jgi:hypothetical protein